jgi:hypothetical protein
MYLMVFRRYGNWILISTGLLIFAWGIYFSTKGSVRIEWSTSSELDTIGYLIYRSKVGTAPPILISDELIPSSLNPMIGGVYEYVDQDVEPGHIYRYLLEEISKDGKAVIIAEAEVKAQRGGKLELIISVFFISLGLFGIILGKRSQYNNESQW